MPVSTALTDSVKTRIPKEWRTQLERVAKSENLDLSDIVRRALSQFIDRRARAKSAK